MARKRNAKSKKRGKEIAVTNIPKLVVNQPVYAKITGFCPWPAKVTHLFGRWCDVFFFGTSERYVIPIHLLFLVANVQVLVFTYSQCRGINIPLESVTNLYEGQSFKEKFARRKGFSKAYDEMQLFIGDTANDTVSTKQRKLKKKKKN